MNAHRHDLGQSEAIEIVKTDRAVSVKLTGSALETVRYLVGPRPARAVRHCPDHLDWSRSGCPRTSMAGLRAPKLM